MSDKVYLVLEMIPWEPFEIVGVYKNKDDAEQAAEHRNTVANYNVSYTVEEHDLI